MTHDSQLEVFLSTQPSVKRPNARRTLRGALVCADGTWPRHLVLERLVEAGAALVDASNLEPLADLDHPRLALEVRPGVLLNPRQVTPTGLHFVAFLLSRKAAACPPPSSDSPASA